MSGDAPRDYSLFGDAHVARYEETDGDVGFLWNGATCLVLHAKLMLEPWPDDDDYQARTDREIPVVVLER